MIFLTYFSSLTYFYRVHLTPFMWIATFNFFTLLTGFTQRHKNKKLHASLMSLGMISDLSLVLVLEFQRDAIATAMAFKLSPLNQAHIFCSSIATLLYFPVFYFGTRLLWGNATPRTRTFHRRLGYTALLFRGLGFLLMFSMRH